MVNNNRYKSKLESDKARYGRGGYLDFNFILEKHKKQITR